MPDLRGASDGDSSRSVSGQELAAMSIVRVAAGFQSLARPEVNHEPGVVCMCIYLCMYVCM